MGRASHLALRVVEALPPRLSRSLVRLHNSSALVRGITRRIRAAARQQPATLHHGEAAGLRFAASSAAVGYGFGSYELEIQERFAEAVPEGGVVLDLGAHVGLFTLVAARRVGHDGSVYALEPDPVSADHIRRSASLNGFDHVHVIEKAAWNRTGSGWFVVPGGKHEWALVVGEGEQSAPVEDAVRVELAAVDDLVETGELPPPSLVKIDVQGAEAKALDGMRSTLGRHRPLILCELHGTAAEIFPLLAELGYEASAIEGGSSPDEVDPGGHLLARPRT